MDYVPWNPNGYRGVLQYRRDDTPVWEAHVPRKRTKGVGMIDSLTSLELPSEVADAVFTRNADEWLAVGGREASR